MSKSYAYGILAVSAAVALALAGCSGGGQSQGPAGEQQTVASSASGLAGLATRGLDVDYDPLASPEAAAGASEMMVRGKLVDVTDGITHSGKAEQAGRGNPYATFVIDVDASLKGSLAKGTKVYVQVNKSSTSNPAELANLGKGLDVVAVLDDISGWSPAPGVTVVRPAGMPATGPLYLAFPDGLWLQGTADKAMVGVHAHAEELDKAWGAPQTLDQYWATLQKAAG